MDVIGGLDLGGTKIQAVVLSRGKVVGSARVPTPAGDARAVMTALSGSLRTALAQAGGGEAKLSGIGIGSPGSIDRESGSVSRAANVFGGDATVRLGPLLSRAFGGIRVAVDNDVRVGVLGEYLQGAGRPFKDVLGVWVGTGVGGGLILDGRLREGRGAAGEIGHAVVKDGGRRCSCGRRGCLEAYAGRGRMEVVARRRIAAGTRSDLLKIMDSAGRDRVTSGVIDRALQKKDRLTTALVDDAVWALGLAIASAQNVLDLEAVIIGGGLGTRLGQPFADRVVAAMQPHLFVSDHPPKVLAPALGDLSGAIGAALLIA